MKHHSFLLAMLCTLGLTANAAVGDTFTVTYPSGSSSYDVKYKVTGESPATVKTVEQSDYHTSMPEGMAIVVPQTVMHEGVEYTVTAVGTSPSTDGRACRSLCPAPSPASAPVPSART